jgi:hypothetical protein
MIIRRDWHRDSAGPGQPEGTPSQADIRESSHAASASSSGHPHNCDCEFPAYYFKFVTGTGKPEYREDQHLQVVISNLSPMGPLQV